MSGPRQVLCKDKLILVNRLFHRKVPGSNQGTKPPNGVYQSSEVRQTYTNEKGAGVGGPGMGSRGPRGPGGGGGGALGH